MVSELGHFRLPRITQKPDKPKKQNKEALLAEFLQKNCRWLRHNRSCSPCRRHPHINGPIAQAVSIKILAALFQ
jgi:hypothetical protein